MKKRHRITHTQKPNAAGMQECNRSMQFKKTVLRLGKRKINIKKYYYL